MFDISEIEKLALSKMFPNARPTPQEHLYRRQIEAMVNCPKCFSGAGYPCYNNGHVDFPHVERKERYITYLNIVR